MDEVNGPYLKKCPFCGSSDVRLFNHSNFVFGWTVRCISCWAEIQRGFANGAHLTHETHVALDKQSKSEVIKAWNSRVFEDTYAAAPEGRDVWLNTYKKP